MYVAMNSLSLLFLYLLLRFSGLADWIPLCSYASSSVVGYLLVRFLRRENRVM